LIRVEAVRNDKTIAVRSCKVTVISGDAVPVIHQAPNDTQPHISAVAPTDFYLPESEFSPTGWMGDGIKGQTWVQFEKASQDHPHSGPTCQKWTYTKGDAGWAAVAWQFPANNWGTQPGKNLSNRGFTKVTWYARGAEGGEEVEFFAGGNTAPEKPYQSSFAKVSKSTALSRDWQKFSLDISGLDLSSVVCAFGWAVVAAEHPTTFFVDDVQYE
jgi:hypothetical protein